MVELDKLTNTSLRSQIDQQYWRTGTQNSNMKSKLHTATWALHPIPNSGLEYALGLVNVCETGKAEWAIKQAEFAVYVSSSSSLNE